MRVLTSELASVLDGELSGPDVMVDEASIDSREIEADQLFVPLVAQRDGHDFIEHALAAGAAAYLTAGEAGPGTAIQVRDTTAALTRLGGWARDRLPARVVGITGSVGKTTAKDFARAVLARRFVTTASERSFNNELGVPLTLFNAPDRTEAAVIEMGARRVGHIADLCVVARPTIGAVTTVGYAHTELFGGLDEVVRAKGELVEALPATGFAVLNADVEPVVTMAARTAAHVVTFGLGRADIRATGVQVDDELRAHFVLESEWGRAEVDLPVRGEHQVTNALAAAAVGLVAEIDVGDVAEGLAAAELSPWRMELLTVPSGALVINDSYNANPVSTEAALRSLARLGRSRATAVLGPMAELGHLSASEHERIAALARSLHVRVVAVSASEYGGEVEHVRDLDAALEVLGPLGESDAVLVKGSRVAGLERLAAALSQPQ